MGDINEGGSQPSENCRVGSAAGRPHPMRTVLDWPFLTVAMRDCPVSLGFSVFGGIMGVWVLEGDSLTFNSVISG